VSQSKKEELKAILNEKTSLVNLSSAQERLWFLQILESESSFYNNFAVFRVGEINYSILLEAIHSIVAQSVLLRSKIISVSGKPFFAETRDYRPVVDRKDFSNQSLDQLEYAIQQDISERIDLDKTGLYRIKVYKHDNDHYLVFNFHHIILDGWSLGLFFAALSRYYTILSNHGRIEQKDYVIDDHFSEFVKYEREDLLASGDTRIQYWKEELSDYTDFEFPLDKSRPKKNAYIGKKKELQIEGELYSQFSRLCKKNRLTTFSGLLTVFYILLTKYTKQNDVVVGTAYANRLSMEFEKTIGTFLNSIPIRLNINDPSMSFIECAKSVQRTVLENQMNQIPFVKIVECLNLERDLSKNMLFQILFVFQNMGLSTPQFNGSQSEYLSEYYNNTSRMDLEIHIWEKDEAYTVYLFYNSELFYDETIDLLLSHFHTLFDECANSGKSVAQFALPPYQIDGVLRPVISDEYKSYDIFAGFHETVHLTPDKTALVFKGQNITYSALNDLVNRLRDNIMSLDMNGNYVIGLYLERSIEMVAMIIAVISSGCAYMPIDPTIPVERAFDIIKDSNINYLFHNLKEDDSRLRELSDKAVVQLVDIHRNMNSAPLDENHAEQNHLAYIMYTSGSTRTPKGVMVTRENLQNYLLGWDKVITRRGTWLGLTNYNFDPSIIELVWAMNNSSRVVLCPGNILQFFSGNQYHEILKKHYITHLQLVPSLAKLIFADRSYAKYFDTLEYVFIGGELSTKELYRTILSMTSARLMNLYGTTETTVWATYHEVSDADEPNVIGAPLENVTLMILDEDKQPAPQNIPGELYMAGPCVTMGYINNPKLTEDKFTIIHGQKAYQTGDICKIDSRGRLIIVGRNDRQIKLRGFRIELEEIEAHITRLSNVKECQVLLCGENENEMELVAFISVNDFQNLQSNREQINQFLKMHLPFYMVPSKYMFFDSLPRNNNGKSDLKKLKAAYYKERSSMIHELSTQAQRIPYERVSGLQDWIYCYQYRVAGPVIAWEPGQFVDFGIVFVDGITADSKNLIDRLGCLCKEIVVIHNSSNFEIISPVEYGMDIQSYESYQSLFNQIFEQDRPPATVFNIWGINTESEYHPETYKSLSLAYFNFFKTMMNFEDNILDVSVIATNGLAIDHRSQVNHNKSFIQIACTCFSQEEHVIHCTYLDFDGTELQENQNHIFESAIAESHNRSSRDLIVRQGNYYEISYRKANLTSGTNNLLTQDTYLIFGGVKGVGLEMAHFLSKKTGVTLVLVGKSKFPSEETWDELQSAESAEGEKWRERIARIKQIKDNGARVIIKHADITNIQELFDLDKSLKEMNIKVNTVINSAAKGNTGFIRFNEKDKMAPVIHNKTIGAYNIHKVFGDQIEFLVFNSSLSSVLGGVAGYDYCVSNIALDTYGHYLNNRGYKVITINWDAWKEVGMAYDAARKFNKDHNQMLSDGITIEEAAQLLHLIFSSNINDDCTQRKLIISFYPLMERYKDRYDFSLFDPFSLLVGPEQTKSLIEDSEIHNIGLEDKLKTIWKAVLKVETVGLNDNFFDLGGNSILLIQVLDMLKKVVDQDITVNTLFNYPTISALVQYIEQRNQADHVVAMSESINKESGKERLNKRLQRMKKGNDLQ